jgi:hypothetical protein
MGKRKLPSKTAKRGKWDKFTITQLKDMRDDYSPGTKNYNRISSAIQRKRR